MESIVTSIQKCERARIVKFIRWYLESANFSDETKNEILKLASNIEMQS